MYKLWLVDQLPMVYCAIKLMEKTCLLNFFYCITAIDHKFLLMVYRHDKPLGMLEVHSKNSQVTHLQLVIYKFFKCSSNIPCGLSAYKP